MFLFPRVGYHLFDEQAGPIRLARVELWSENHLVVPTLVSHRRLHLGVSPGTSMIHY